MLGEEVQGLNLSILPDGRRALIMRTSDRLNFKSCRRKWNWSSHLKENLAPIQLSSPLWFGSAIHYALEDYHGYNVFGHPREAFKAYCIATAKNYKRDLPPDAQEHFQLGKAMMTYYADMWLAGYPRKAYDTYWEEDPITNELIPQVEVNFEIPIPFEALSRRARRYAKLQGIDVVLYRGTIDRIAIDEFGALWVVEYKTAKVAQNLHFQTDPQVSTYVWAATLIYNKPVAGVIYHQFVKREPKPPPLLSSTGRISTAANMVSSYPLYKQQLLALYGDFHKASSKEQAFLNQLISSETDEKDRYIQREKIERSPNQCMHEAQSILLELEDMMNPDLPLYSAPTRDCSRMCSFVTPCVNFNDGSDWEGLLSSSYASRDQDVERIWRARLPKPSELLLQYEANVEPDLIDMNVKSQEDYKLACMAAGEYEEVDGQLYNPFEGISEKGTFNMSII